MVLYQPNDPKKGCDLDWCEVGRSLIDTDGFYQIVYKHKGRPTDYRVAIIKTDEFGNETVADDCGSDSTGAANNPKTVNLKGNEFEEVNFFELDPTCGGFVPDSFGGGTSPTGPGSF